MLHVFKHELRLIFRDPRFWIPFIIPPVILAASQAIAVSRYGGEIMQGMGSYMMLLLGCLMAPMGAPLAGDSFAGERERNSLELVLLTTAFSLMVSLRVKTVRAATHMTLFFIIPLLLLVQLGHETFLSNLFVPLVFLALSVVISVAVTFAGMKKFVSL